MNLAIIASGFFSESTSVDVIADVTDGTIVLVFDDETKEQIGSGTITDGLVSISISPGLYAGQRIIAYVSQFGQDTYGAVVVTETEVEKTGWKTPETVNGTPYEDYLEAGGDRLPDLYTPQECRNLSRDIDAIKRVLDLPITFLLRQVESSAGTIQVLVENIKNAFGGYKIKFDSDAEGSTTNKTYSVNGSYGVKVWGANQTIEDAIQVTYNLVMPTATVEFGDNIIDLHCFVDFGYAGSPGQKAVIFVAHTSVACEFQVDGLFAWESGYWQTGGLAFRSNIKLVPAGEYTVRARNSAVPSEQISRQIKLSNF